MRRLVDALARSALLARAHCRSLDPRLLAGYLGSGYAVEFAGRALVTAVGEAGLVDTLNNAPELTVFAPVNDAGGEGIVGTNHFMPENLIPYLHLPRKPQEAVAELRAERRLRAGEHGDGPGGGLVV